MTIRDLCAVTELSDVAIKNLESNKFNASLPNLRMFAKLLHVSIGYLNLNSKNHKDFVLTSLPELFPTTIFRANEVVAPLLF